MRSSQNPPGRFEQSVRRVLRRRRFAVGIVAVLVLAALGYAGNVLWQALREQRFVPPDYRLDSESVTYWRDRTMADLNALPKEAPLTERERVVHRRLDHTFNAARQIASETQRMEAIADIALTLTGHDEKYNLAAQLTALKESASSKSLYARVLVSQALMNLRLGNRTAARVAIHDFRNWVNEADIKLDSDDNILAFLGAVTTLAVMDDRAFLTELFQRQTDFSLRVSYDQRSRAFRILAGEQARVDMSLPAVLVTQRIANPVELVRAYQLLIARIARPAKIEPVEPTLADLNLLDPNRGDQRPPLASATVARRVVNEVLQLIAQKDELDMQIHLLVGLAGSQLMCDSEIYALFLEAVEKSDLDELVKRPVLKLLREPESDIIRAALGMPPLEKKRVRTVDPAFDDWSSSDAALSVELAEIDPETVKMVSIVQTLRAQNNIAQSELLVTRYHAAAVVLRQAVKTAQNLSDAEDRVDWLLKLGTKQLSAGDSAAALETLRLIGLPDPSELSTVFTPERLSTLARLQIVGRFYDDALKTTERIQSETTRNADLVFLATEQLRAGLWDDAEKTLAPMAASSRAATLRHVLALGRGDQTAEHWAALNIPAPGSLPASREGDPERKRCCELLLQRGLYELAGQTAESITEPALRDALLYRIARENMLLFRAHRLSSEQHLRIRQTLLDRACRLAEKVEDVQRRAVLRESMLADIPSQQAEMFPSLTSLVEQTLQDCRAITDEGVKAELLAKILLTQAQTPTEKRDEAAMRRQFEPRVQEVLDAINQAEAGLPRGDALTHLADALNRMGRKQSAQSMIEAARDMAQSLNPPQEAVSVLLALIPVLPPDDSEAAKALYDEAFARISEAYADVLEDAENLHQWRLHDLELDRLVRHQMQYGHVDLAVAYSVRIAEPLLRERLQRAAAYLFLDQQQYDLAESTIRRTQLPELSANALRDILFTKRQKQPAQ